MLLVRIGRSHCTAAAPHCVGAAGAPAPHRPLAGRRVKQWPAHATSGSSSGSGRSGGETPAGVWDLVEYVDPAAPQRRVRLGLVAAVRADAAPPLLLVEPLVMAANEEGAWAHDEDAGTDGVAVAPGAVLRTITEYDLQSRQDPVGPGNPHGEHAHDVFLPLVPLAPDVYTGKQ